MGSAFVGRKLFLVHTGGEGSFAVVYAESVSMAINVAKLDPNPDQTIFAVQLDLEDPRIKDGLICYRRSNDDAGHAYD